MDELAYVNDGGARYDPSDRTALLATHIDPGWTTPDGFDDIVDQYIASDDHDAFIYVSNPEERYNKGNYEDVADEVYHSDFGSLNPSDVEGLLDEYDEFVHIGAYWGQCHSSTFKSMIDGIASRPNEKHTISMPIEGVTTLDYGLMEAVQISGGLSALYEDLNTSIDAEVSMKDGSRGWQGVIPRLRCYTDPVDDLFDRDDLVVELEKEPVPMITWRFNPDQDGGSRFDATDELLDDLGIDRGDYYGWN